jgi:hypothetical protein
MTKRQQEQGRVIDEQLGTDMNREPFLCRTSVHDIQPPLRQHPLSLSQLLFAPLRS